jgi:putative serine protease PepD
VEVLLPVKTTATLFDVVIGTRSGTQSGSGVILGDQGLVITAAHVIEGKRTETQGLLFVLVEPTALFIRTTNDVQAGCKIARVDKEHDLALLQCDGLRGTHGVTLLADDNLPVGQHVVTSGFPAGAFHILADGIVANHLAKGKIAVSVPIGPGMSGGGVFTYNGTLVGIIQMYLGSPPFTGIITSTSQLREFLYQG